MKKRILCLLLALIMVLSMLVACGGGNTPEDPDDDKKDPNKDKPTGEINWWDTITYESTNLRFMMTKNSNGNQLSSGCERYLAGEKSEGKDLDDLITQRNEDAYFNTNVTVTYMYYPDDDDHAWTDCIEIIFEEVMNNSADSPDLYCNFMSDMLTTSLRGSFANLYSRVRGVGEQKGVNYFIPDQDTGNEGYAHSGYMSDLMSSLTLSNDKIYCIASDYFLDLIRAFFVVPVNRTLYNGLAPEMIEDLNNDGVKDMNDLFIEVENGDWTYARMAQYCAKVYVPTSEGESATIQDTIGFALSSGDGLPASGLVYTSDITIINKVWSDEKGGYVYFYPGSSFEDSDDPDDVIQKHYGDVDYGDTEDMEDFGLYELCHELKTLFEGPGVAIAGTNEIRQSFVQDTILFGGIILVGALEDADYQSMKEGERGFGVLPVPVYKKYDTPSYLSQIHTIGRCGGISHATKKFAQCSAFVQYQSTHSTEILNEYYDYNLILDVSDGISGNVTMLKYIRENVRTAFDKLFEDSIGLFFETTSELTRADRWHHIVMASSYQVEIRANYEALMDKKQQCLLDLEKEYSQLPD